MKIDWTPGVPQSPSDRPDFYASEAGDYSVWVEIIRNCPEEPERPGNCWVWMIDGPDNEGIMSILASGVEYGAASARQTAERAVYLRQHGVTSDFTEKRMTTFETFKDGPAREILSRIGVDLDACLGWADFRSRFVEQNREMRDKNPDDSLASHARDLDGILSTGERSVLHAALAAADFADIADELWNWEVIDRLDPSHREAVAAAILREDAV